AGRPAELAAGSEWAAAAVEAPRAATWAPGEEEGLTARPLPRPRGPRTGLSRTRQPAPARPAGLAGLVRYPPSGSLHRALRAQRHSPGPGKWLPLTGTSCWREVRRALGDEGARHDAARLQRNPFAPRNDQAAGLARAEPCRARGAQELGALQHRLRQLGDVSAEVREFRLDIDHARGGECRGGAEHAVAHEKGVCEDSDVPPWAAERIGAYLTAVEDDKPDRVSPGAQRDVTARADAALNTRGDLTVEEVHLGSVGCNRNVAAVGECRLGRDAGVLHGQVVGDDVHVPGQRAGGSTAARGNGGPVEESDLRRRDIDITTTSCAREQLTRKHSAAVGGYTPTILDVDLIRAQENISRLPV